MIVLRRASADDLAHRLLKFVLDLRAPQTENPNLEGEITTAVHFGISSGLTNEQQIAELATLYILSDLVPEATHRSVLSDQTVEWNRRLETIFEENIEHDD